MIIEIRKAGFVNKGAELMLHAAMEKIKERYPEAIFVMAPTSPAGGHPFHKLAKLGFHPKAWLRLYGIQWGDFAALLPKKLRDMYGLILDSEIDVIIDASGFDYSDQWGDASSKDMVRISKRWKKQGTKVILLPQALGPFTSSGIKAATKSWVNNVDLIFAREKDSYKYLTDLVGEQEKIKLFPDFTNLLDGTLPKDYNSSDKRIALVPNYRMVDKTNKEQSEAYLPFMIHCANYLIAKGLKPFVLVHEGANDEMLAKNISEAAGNIPIVKETDPLHIKGILGTCDATIGSRFHGLVSALSQGVPSLATGWSHKYLRLFEDYNFEQGLVSVLDSKEAINQQIDSITQTDDAARLKNQLNIRSQELKDLSAAMWDLVFHEMDKKQAKV